MAVILLSHLFRDWRLKHILRKHKPFYSGNGVSKTQEFLMKMSQFVSITLVIILGMFLNSCGQMTANDEGMASKSIEEASVPPTPPPLTTPPIQQYQQFHLPILLILLHL